MSKPEPQIQNIYRLLAYALRAVDVATLEKVNYDQYSGLDSVLAEILIAGVTTQRKKGLEHGYQEQRGDLQFVKGRLNVLETHIRRQRGSLLADCSFDEFVIDTYNNQILKAALLAAVSNRKVLPDQKGRIRGLLPFFDSVADVPVSRIVWNAGKYDRNNASYRILKHISYMLIHGLGIETSDNQVLTTGIEVKSKNILFQNFVAEYFRRHFPSLKVRTEPVLKKGITTPKALMPPAVPRLQPDIVLESSDHTLVIDTKFYRKILVPNRYGKKILRPEHRNQIFTYVQHLAVETPKRINGMLLYAQTQHESAQETNFKWEELGHNLEVRTVDLNQDFNSIADSLDQIIFAEFPEVMRAN